MPAPEQVTLQRLVDAADGELWAFLDSEVRAARREHRIYCHLLTMFVFIIVLLFFLFLT